MPRKARVRRRRPTSQPYGPRRDSGSPLPAAAGAAIGAAAGRAIARKTNMSRAQRAVAKEMAGFVGANKELFGSEERERNMQRSAESVYNSEYRKMPRIKDKAKLDVYKELTRRGKESPSAARKMAGLSQSETNKYYNKSAAKYAPSSVSDKLFSAAQLREERTRTRAGRKGAAAGGITGVAATMIAQAIIKELNKKR